MAKEVETPASSSDDLARPKTLRRRLNYARGYDYVVEVQCCDDYDCGISTYYVEPVKEQSDVAKRRFTFFGFTSNVTTNAQARASQNEVYFLAHMYVPWYFDQMKQNRAPLAVKDELANVVPPPEDENSALGLFMLKQYSYGENSFNTDHPVCRKRGEFGCPLTLHIPKDAKLQQSRRRGDDDEVLGYFTFNGMRFYPFLMIDYTVCYFICDAGSPYDWNRHPDGRVKKPWEIYPLVALDAPVSYDATLGIWATRSAHLMPLPEDGC
jgi:hypothetical protein